MRDCPDLSAMSPAQRAEFWSQADPRELRRLGDRLLAESLPREEPSPREPLAQQALTARKEGGWSRAQGAELLGVTESMLAAWEDDRVRSPDSLPLVFQRLRALGVPAE